MTGRDGRKFIPGTVRRVRALVEVAPDAGYDDDGEATAAHKPVARPSS
jgi:hypothetical protein